MAEKAHSPPLQPGARFQSLKNNLDGVFAVFPTTEPLAKAKSSRGPDEMQILPRRRLATGRLPGDGRGGAAQQAKRERVHPARPSPLHVATQWVKKQVRKLNSGHRLPPPTTVDADETPTLPNNGSDCHQLSVGPPKSTLSFPRPYVRGTDYSEC